MDVFLEVNTPCLWRPIFIIYSFDSLEATNSIKVPNRHFFLPPLLTAQRLLKGTRKERSQCCWLPVRWAVCTRNSVSRRVLCLVLLLIPSHQLWRDRLMSWWNHHVTCRSIRRFWQRGTGAYPEERDVCGPSLHCLPQLQNKHVSCRWKTRNLLSLAKHISFWIWMILVQ